MNEKTKEKVLNHYDAGIKAGIITGFIPLVFCLIGGGIIALIIHDVFYLAGGAFVGIAAFAYVFFKVTFQAILIKKQLLKSPEAWEEIDLSSLGIEEEEEEEPIGEDKPNQQQLSLLLSRKVYSKETRQLCREKLKGLPEEEREMLAGKILEAANKSFTENGFLLQLEKL